ncbi:hypothetical protein IEQ34_004964 [Dendrobium chrysotoxum]|uniref:Uncharacterized protein n=1 Tax=Dendrobium chrysotoxum TaxID=161865 RepID=A0AAV7H7J9_DENCH|nr:hypothetical protein IEQ34_004964 [Dendrobium chrysotoxum]
MTPPHLRCLSATCFSWSPPSSFSFSLLLRKFAMSVKQRTSYAEGKPALRGVVFDMDGTLTVPVIDFAAMYRAVLGDEGYTAAKFGSPGGSVDILHHIETWPPQEQQRAYEIIADFERQGLDRLQIMPGAAELCGYIDSKQMRRGLITRNVKAAVDLFHRRFGVTCGKQAGAFTCLLDENGRYGPIESLSKDLQPDFQVSSLSEVQSLLDINFVLLPHPQTTL